MRPIGLVVLAVSLGGCAIIDDEPAPPWMPGEPEPARLRVTEVNVDESDPFSNLEVEVHLYDADSGARLGCAGEHQGLEPVDRAGFEYYVLADFVDTSGATLWFADVAQRNLIVEVLERDDGGCPGEPRPEDDVIDVSDPIEGASFDPALQMTFGDVTHLVIGTAPTRLD